MAKKLFLIVCCAALTMSFCVEGFAQQKNSLTIVETIGDVLVMKAGQKNWQAAQPGADIAAGDRIKTAPKASAMLVLNGDFKNAIKLKAQTEVMVEGLNPLKMYMPGGEVLSKLDNLEKGSTFEIRTPTAVAGVAGTGFKTSYDPKSKKFAVAVHEGKVKVKVPEKTAYKNTRGLAFADGYTEYEIPADVKAVLDEAGLTQEALSRLDREEWEEFVKEIREIIREYEDSGVTDRGVLIDKIEKALEDADKDRDDRFEIQDIEKQEERLKPEEKPDQGGSGMFIIAPPS